VDRLPASQPIKRTPKLPNPQITKKRPALRLISPPAVIARCDPKAHLYLFLPAVEPG